MPAHLIFDFDGVIADTFDFHRRMVREIAGISLSEDELRDVHNGNFYEHTNTKIRGFDAQQYASAVAPAQRYVPLMPFL